MKELRIAVFASGHGSNLQAILDSIRDRKLKNVNVSLVVSDQADARALTLARRARIPAVHVSAMRLERKAHEQAILPHLERNRVDAIVLAGYQRLLSPFLLRHYPGRIINIHPALLPNYPGLHAIQRAFEDGVKHSGVTVHVVDKGMDTGPVLAQKNVPLKKGDSLEDFETRMHEAEHDLLPRVLQQLANAHLRTRRSSGRPARRSS